MLGERVTDQRAKSVTFYSGLLKIHVQIFLDKTTHLEANPIQTLLNFSALPYAGMMTLRDKKRPLGSVCTLFLFAGLFLSDDFY